MFLFLILNQTLYDLNNILPKLRWKYSYKVNVFDCSNMSSALATYLNSYGFKAWLISKDGHIWVRCRTKEGYLIDIEATNLTILPQVKEGEELRDLAKLRSIDPKEYDYPVDCLTYMPVVSNVKSTWEEIFDSICGCLILIGIFALLKDWI